jgi:hypothetical protein
MRMSAMGHKQTSRHVCVMSVIPLKADIHQMGPFADEEFSVTRFAGGAFAAASSPMERLGH